MSDWANSILGTQQTPSQSTNWADAALNLKAQANNSPMNMAPSPLTAGMDPSKFYALTSGILKSIPNFGGQTGQNVNSQISGFAPFASANPGYETAGKVGTTALLGALGPAENASTIPSALSGIAKNAGLAELSLGGASAGQAIDPNSPLGPILGGILAPLSASGLMSAISKAPSILEELGTKISQIRGKPLLPSQLDPLVSQYINSNAKQPLSSVNIPKVSGFNPTPAAASNDLGLYPIQAALRGKGYNDLFEQRVADNNAAITQGLRKLGPQISDTQVSTQAAQRLGDLNKQAQIPVQQAYAPFDAIKNAVHIPADTIVSPVDNVLSGLNSSERDMLPQSTMKKIMDWEGVVPINEVEGVRSALGDAAQMGGKNTARVIRKVQNALDNGLSNVQSIHNADGSFMAPINGQAPLQMMQNARAANTAYRQQFPTQQSKNTPAQNFIAKVITGKIAPSNVLDTAMNTPENIDALLKASANDPEIVQLAQNHYVNKLFDASSNRAGGIAGGQLINGYAMRDFRNGNTAVEGKLFQNPSQRAALDGLQNAAIMNNNILRKAVPGESGTNPMGNVQDNMADYLHQGVVAGLEHLVPGAGLASKMLGKLASSGEGAQQLQFRNRVAQALLDVPTYTKLRNMPISQKNIKTVGEMLKEFPAVLNTSFMKIASNPGSAAAVTQ